jgi:hypothetical protein
VQQFEKRTKERTCGIKSSTYDRIIQDRAESSYSINGDIRELATKAAEFPSQQEV